MAKALPQPFKYRGRWRAQVTCKNGTRPHADFDDHASALDWIVTTLANANSEHQPELGGPTQATLAQSLNHYAHLLTINKGGIDSELNRINHYLESNGLKSLRKAKNKNDQLVLETYDPKQQPKGWQDHNDARRAKRTETYEAIHALGAKRCSVINTADIRRLMTTMKTEGLSDSSIQKEIALLRHLFNVAAREWQWKGFENPTEGLKLGSSQSRFVFITKEQEAALWAAVAQCDNPYFWPLVVCALETTMRRGSLLGMRWDKTDLEGRIAQVPSKTGFVNVPLSQHIVSVLSDMPRHPSGTVFPMSGNAVEMAWDGARIKAGLPTLQFKDIRHLGATAYARRGLNAHQLKAILGHKTLFMAQVYVNLVAQDVLNVMDATAPVVPVIQVPPPAKGSGEDILKARRSTRLADAVLSRMRANCAEAAPPVETPSGADTPFAAHAEDVQEAAPMPVPPFDDETAQSTRSDAPELQASAASAPDTTTQSSARTPAQHPEKSETADATATGQVASNVLMFRARPRAA